MYITNTTDNVRELIEKLEQKDDLNKLKFLIYIFGLLNNNQINDKNEANPDLVEDDDMKILSMDTMGLPDNYCTILLQYFVMVYKVKTKTDKIYEDNGNVFGIEYSDDDKKLASDFEKLNFNEKLDVFSEIVIRYDNETYFDEKITMLSFDSELSGFDIAKRIQDFKN